VINVAKWALLALLALPLLELAAFLAVAAVIGFGWALCLVLGGSLAGGLILRHAGGSHVARMRVAFQQGHFTMLETDRAGGYLLIAGILLLIPGFITDLVALCLLVPPLRRALSKAILKDGAPVRNDGVVDLAPDQWRQVRDPSLADRRRRQHDDKDNSDSRNRGNNS
jgi:UPF0716 protein FxsA